MSQLGQFGYFVKIAIDEVDDGFYQQKEGMAMGNSLSPIVSNIYMEHFNNWPSTRRRTNRRCGSGMWTTLL
jgi:hypothetical protein